MFFGMHWIDITVIALYFLIVIYIGFRVMRKVKTQEDCFLGGRQFNRFYQTFSQFGQATGSESAANTEAVVGVNGIAGALQQTIMGAFSYPVSWLFPKWLRRTRLMSMAGFFVERFGSKKLAGVYAIAQVCLFLMAGGMGLYATSKTLMAITGKPVEALSVAERAEYDQSMRLSSLSSQPMELMSTQERSELDRLREIAPAGHFSYLNFTVLVFSIALIVFLYAVTGGLFYIAPVVIVSRLGR
jgi:SSS family solute:Na+ symporter